METVKYLCPVPQEHGHWVQPENEPQRVITDQKWVAIEKEVEDALTTTRRCLREKTSVRKMEVEEKEPKSEENAERKVSAAEAEIVRNHRRGNETHGRMGSEHEENDGRAK